MARHPDDGMFSIKLVKPGHLGGDFHTPPRDHKTDVRQRVMNFRDRPRPLALAESIRPGHRALVYVTHPVMKFIWAIEYTGTLEDGNQAAAAFPVDINAHPEWRAILLPIRFLATIDVNAALDAQVIAQQAGVDFTPHQVSMMHISEAAFQNLFDAINWNWRWVAHPEPVTV